MPRHDDRDVFLLGAGFARAISPTMPLLQDMAERVIATLGDGAHIPDAVRAMMQENFAHALSYLEQAKPWVTEADNLRHRALFLDMSNAIARDLDETVVRACEALGSHAPPWLDRLIRHWHEHGSRVLTLNYDTLIENLASLIEMEDGEHIHAHDVYPPVLTDAGLRSGNTAPRRRAETFRLLKLHGSTNWYYSGRVPAHGEPIYFVPPRRCDDPEDRSHDARAAHDSHDQRLRAVADKYPFLVPPIYDKSPLLTHETIRALWFDAGAALQRAHRVICMGYSLPGSDLTMMHFLRTTCASDARIVLVNQSENARESFERLFRGTDVQIEQATSGERCIADFVSDHM